MARYVASAQVTAGSTTLPIISLYAAAGVGGSIVEIGVLNFGGTGVGWQLTRLTSQGTPGAAITPGKFDPDSAAAACTPFNTHTVAPTLGDDLGYRTQSAGALGNGAIWSFPYGIDMQPGTGNGVGIITIAAGVTASAYIVWDEDEL